MKHILLEHSNRYPKMEINDYVKLIHQSVFGPAHFSKQPNKEQLINYLKEELFSFKHYPKTPMIEPIGNDYYRLSLNLIINNILTVEKLASLFLFSMKTNLNNQQNLIKQMNHHLNLLLRMVKNKEIDLDYENSSQFVDQYRMSDFPAIHHSITYQKLYFPHYRVVHQKYLPL